MRTLFFLCLILSNSLVAEELQHIDGKGYRNSHYRAPLPDSVPNGTTLNTADLQQLIESQPPILIDVLAIAVRPETVEFGLSWLPNEVRLNIPGSIWLPNVGYGELDETMHAYFKSNLALLASEKPKTAMVFYCITDCWMSWNAVQRAHEYGYRNLYWYPIGTEGWEEAGLPLTESIPVPLTEDQ